GLNVGLGSTDDRAAILENRRLAIAAAAPGRRLVTVHQDHSADALYADAPWPDDARPKADAIVTDRPGLALGILTADCTPARLGAAGIRQGEALGLDTYADPERFYSYRRATHRGEPDYGRQLSLIALPG